MVIPSFGLLYKPWNHSWHFCSHAPSSIPPGTTSKYLQVLTISATSIANLLIQTITSLALIIVMAFKGVSLFLFFIHYILIQIQNDVSETRKFQHFAQKSLIPPWRKCYGVSLRYLSSAIRVHWDSLTELWKINSALELLTWISKVLLQVLHSSTSPLAASHFPLFLTGSVPDSAPPPTSCTSLPINPSVVYPPPPHIFSFTLPLTHSAPAHWSPSYFWETHNCHLRAPALTLFFPRITGETHLSFLISFWSTCSKSTLFNCDPPPITSLPYSVPSTLLGFFYIAFITTLYG